MADEQTTQQTNGTHGTNGTDGTQTGAQNPPEAPAEKTMTQAEVNGILAREKAAWKKAADEERKRAEMTEAERLKAEKEAAEKLASDASAAANARIVRTEARAALADAGVKLDRRDYALRMLDLSSISVGDDGEPDAKALSAAVAKLLADVPELKGAGTSAAGSEMNGGAGGAPNPETMSMPDYLEWRKKQK